MLAFLADVLPSGGGSSSFGPLGPAVSGAAVLAWWAIHLAKTRKVRARHKAAIELVEEAIRQLSLPKEERKIGLALTPGDEPGLHGVDLLLTPGNYESKELVLKNLKTLGFTYPRTEAGALDITEFLTAEEVTLVQEVCKERDKREA